MATIVHEHPTQPHSVPTTLEEWSKHVKLAVNGYAAYFSSFFEPYEQYVGGGADVVSAAWPGPGGTDRSDLSCQTGAEGRRHYVDRRRPRSPRRRRRRGAPAGGRGRTGRTSEAHAGSRTADLLSGRPRRPGSLSPTSRSSPGSSPSRRAALGPWRPPRPSRRPGPPAPGCGRATFRRRARASASRV